jgi:uncharacterized membrane protein
MMGGTGPQPFPFYIFIFPTVFIGLIIASVVGLIYYLSFPEIRKEEITKQGKAAIKPEEDSLATVLKTLKPDERKILDVLIEHDGRYLQKFITKDTGLTRLKTHRIVARFAERDIVTVREHGNTNEVIISDWLKQKKE